MSSAETSKLGWTKPQLVALAAAPNVEAGRDSAQAEDALTSLQAG